MWCEDPGFSSGCKKKKKWGEKNTQTYKIAYLGIGKVAANNQRVIFLSYTVFNFTEIYAIIIS